MAALYGRPTLVAALLFCGYLGWNQATPWLAEQQRYVETKAKYVSQQRKLSRYRDLNDTVEKAMATALSAKAGLVRMRVAFIHPPATRDNLPLLRWDLTNELTLPGHEVGPLHADLPISDWSDYLNEMLDGKCAYRRLSGLAEQAAAARVSGMRIQAFIVCPVVIASDRAVLGAVYGSWDEGDPEPADLAATERVVRAAADQIGGAVQGDY